MIKSNYSGRASIGGGHAMAGGGGSSGGGSSGHDESLVVHHHLSSDSTTEPIKIQEQWINTFISEFRASSGSSSSSSSRQDESRKKKAVRTLQKKMMAPEMVELSDEMKKNFYEMITSKILDLLHVSGKSKPEENKIGLMLVCIVLDTPNSTKTQPTLCPQFANYLRNLVLPSYVDMELQELLALAVGKVALYSDPTTNFVEFEISRAIEVISNEQGSTVKKLSAVLILRELASETPSYFFAHIMTFFENIFSAVMDVKLRDSAVSALQAALYVVLEREQLSQAPSWMNNANDPNNNNQPPSQAATSTKISRVDQQIPQCFEICFQRVMAGFDDAQRVGVSTKEREDKIHTSLLILNELFRCSYDTSRVFNESFTDFLPSEVNSFYLSNYLFTHFNHPLTTLTTNLANVNGPHGPGMNTSASSNNLSQQSSGPAAANGGQSGGQTSAHYLTKLFRNYSNGDLSAASAVGAGVAGGHSVTASSVNGGGSGGRCKNMPLYKVRDLNSVVSYHEANGIGPRRSFFNR